MRFTPLRDGATMFTQLVRRSLSASTRVLCFATVAGTVAGTPQPVNASDVSNKVLDVTRAPYKADTTCKKDDRAPLAQALSDAQAGRQNRVYFPPGHYCIKSRGPRAALPINNGWPIVVDGAGRDRVKITVQVPTQDLMSVHTDGVTVQNLTLDAQSCNCGQGHGFGSSANNTLLQHVRVLGGRTPGRFPIYFGGDWQPRGYATGNKVIDVILDDQICDDAFSWSYQREGLIQNVHETGTRVALYKNQNVTVDGYTFTPGVQARTCPGWVTGFVITPPSSGIKINNFKTYGPGGLILPQSPPSAKITNVTITNEQVVNKGFGLEVLDVDGLVIDGGNWGSNGFISFRPKVSADGIMITNVQSLPIVRFILSRRGGATAGRRAGIHFVNDVFPGFTPVADQSPYTFENAFGGSVAFDVSGGRWTKPVGGAFFNGNGKGSNTRCTVTNLVGYTGPRYPC